MEELKACNECGLVKALSEFHYSAQTMRYRIKCRVCANARKRHGRKAQQKVYNRRASLKKRYGITPEDYAALFTAQAGKCAICARADSGVKNQAHFHVDHCHATGKVRGLLCGPCNRAIGCLRDSPEYARNAAHYLETAL